MGEATYYLKASFTTPEDAARVFEEFKRAIARLYELNDRWQSIRGERERSCAERRAELTAEFHDLDGMAPWQTIANHCREIGPDACMNCCAGELPDMSADPYVALHGDEIWLSDTVWHHTSWDGIAEWLRRRGAVGADWRSDEYDDPWWDLGVIEPASRRAAPPYIVIVQARTELEPDDPAGWELHPALTEQEIQTLWDLHDGRNFRTEVMGVYRWTPSEDAGRPGEHAGVYVPHKEWRTE